MAGADKRWFPLESNPDVMAQYMKRLGWPIEQFTFTDIMSTEDWALDMVPKPVQAVLFLFPISESHEANSEAEDAKIKADGQIVDQNLFYMRQTVGNACGTIALLHACCNAITKGISPEKGSWLESFYEKAKGKTPEEIAALLEEDDDIEEAHEQLAQEGQSDNSEESRNVITHFIAFVNLGGHLYELDGRKNVPINHGDCNSEELLAKSTAVIKQFMQRDPEEVRFTMVALSAPAADE